MNETDKNGAVMGHVLQWRKQPGSKRATYLAREMVGDAVGMLEGHVSRDGQGRPHREGQCWGGREP